MSALASTINENVNDSIAQISTNARVDYILRFSKQAVIVLDDIVENYSAVGSQFLGNIPNHHNAAYLSVSPKLNDIQIRARIVEQLYFDQAFDPEKSIAVTLINLVKSAPQTLSIVIEHAQLLSLQIVHELCQLAEIGKKSNLEINILMLGDKRLGQILYDNQSLFQKKVSIVDAQSGQLLAVNAKQFKPQVALFSWTANKVLILGFISLFVVATAIILYLANRDVTKFSGLAAPSAPVSIDAEKLISLAEASATTVEQSNESEGKVAKQTDILSALLGESLPIEEVNEIASVDDVFAALASEWQDDSAKNLTIKETFSVSPTDTIVEPNESVANVTALQQEADRNKVSSELSTHSLNAERDAAASDNEANRTDGIAEPFANYPQGFVVQLGGFRQRSVMESFINVHQASVELHSYQRVQSGKPYWVVTSKVYKTRAEASASIAQLPELLRERSPWVKSVVDVNKERVLNESISE